MQQHDFLDEFWRGLKFQLPYVIAYLIGISIALRYRWRLPLPSLYVFVGCSIKLGVAVAYPATAALLLAERDFALFEIAERFFGVIEASAYGLLLLAVFSGRLVTPRRYLWPDEMDPEEEAPPAPPLPAPKPDNTGIQERK
jgi:hypothetical protein